MTRALNAILDRLHNLRLDPDMPPPQIRGGMMRVPEHLYVRFDRRYRHMKAPIFKGVGKPLVIETLPDPTPGPGEIVIKVSRCGICGTDLHMTDGHAHTFPEGTVIGHEFAGEVVAVGAGVTRFKIGDAAAALPTVGCGHCANCLAGETDGVTLA